MCLCLRGYAYSNTDHSGHEENEKLKATYKSMQNAVAFHVFCLSSRYLCVCKSFQSEQMAEDVGALPWRCSAQSRRAGLRIRDFTAWQPVGGCDLQGSVRSAALWLSPCSSLFSCQGCHTQYSRGGELHDTA